MNKESMAMKHTHHTTHVYYTMVQQPRSYASQVWCFVNSGFKCCCCLISLEGQMHELPKLRRYLIP